MEWSTHSEKSWKDDDDNEDDNNSSDDEYSVPEDEEEKARVVQAWLQGNAIPGKKEEPPAERSNYQKQMDVGQVSLEDWGKM